MEMQDNEFDELFRSKLDGFEATPSDRVWIDINHKLAQKRAAVKWLPGLRIAAGLLIVCSIGIVFFHQTDKNVKLQAAAKHLIKEETKTIAKTNVPIKSAVVSEAKPVNSTTASSLAVAKSANTGHAIHTMVKKIDTVKPADHPKPVNTNDDQMLIASASDRTDLKDPHSTGQTAPPVATTALALQPELITQAPLKPDSIPGYVKHTAAKPVTRHKIKSLGDMLNVVIAKVDKRKDKFIEFSNTDDDESSITGINIGVLKIKKDK